ncbi:SMI1/KNR4 family protein [Curtobacterium sp. C1]|uniref:SMI1/KNR4 family protein n=1 Tax=Curtobacterium sp. C1 TaxID=2898151 RepID=UPI001E45E86C|nr:SMI1/KNR4 family protein [Curtobacterium sp. C1]UFU15655.1 SMI1/KNR4 family protein [Curtobacterium sp. C1]
MDLGRLFRRGNHDPAPADDATDRLRAALARLVARIPGDTMLHPPATEAALTHAETHLGRELPADVRALYLLHDGQHQYTAADPRFAAGLFAGAPLLPVQDLLLNWDNWAGFESREDMDEFASSDLDGFVQAKYSVRGWIPLTHDGSGNHIGVDLDPGPAGTVGQVITFGAEDEAHHVLAPTLASYLEQVSALVASGDIIPSDDEDDPDWTSSRPLSKLFHPTGGPAA